MNASISSRKLWVVAMALLVPLAVVGNPTPVNAEKGGNGKQKVFDDAGHELIYGAPVGDPSGTGTETPPSDVIPIATDSGGEFTAAAYLPYPLKHSFSLSHTNYSVPYSCHITSGTTYFCRLVYGYEEAGSGSNFDVDFLVQIANVVKYSAPYQPNGVDYARSLTYAGGARYEGCYVRDATYFHCDYWTPKASQRPRNTDSGYWVKVLKDWGTYTASRQGVCAATLAAHWAGAADYEQILNDCLSSPFTLGS